MSSRIIFLDACVIYSAPVRDLLMRLVNQGLFKARWSDRIHDEWIESLLRNRPEIPRASLERTRQLMNSAVQDSLVSLYEHRIAALQLPDADDRHVLAAAVESRAEAILTFNLQDFPVAALVPYDIEVIHPDMFVCQLLEHSAESVTMAVKNLRSALRNPPKSANEYLEVLIRSGLPNTAQSLRQYIDQL